MSIKNVLVVDDNILILNYMDIVLSSNGFVCHAFRDGPNAVRFIEDNPMDLSIIDIHMPEMDGLELLRALKALAPSMPVFAISGGVNDGEPIFLQAARKFGADVCIAKPIGESDLISLIHASQGDQFGSDDVSLPEGAGGS